MKIKLLSLVLVITMVMSLFIGVDASAAANDAKGSLLIVGGALGSTNSDVYNKFIELAGGQGQGQNRNNTGGKQQYEKLKRFQGRFGKLWGS